MSQDHIIEQIGLTEELPSTVIGAITRLRSDAGLVNTHHHFFQSLFRAVPAQDHGLFDWLVMTLSYLRRINR
ncbi:MAG: hypothetical protein U0401_20735 [Anaerolineae bacterium]